jgi:hypothetical protein
VLALVLVFAVFVFCLFPTGESLPKFWFAWRAGGFLLGFNFSRQLELKLKLKASLSLSLLPRAGRLLLARAREFLFRFEYVESDSTARALGRTVTVRVFNLPLLLVYLAGANLFPLAKSGVQVVMLAPVP